MVRSPHQLWTRATAALRTAGEHASTETLDMFRDLYRSGELDDRMVSCMHARPRVCVTCPCVCERARAHVRAFMHACMLGDVSKA